MKKYLAIILSILLAVSLFGCKKDQGQGETSETSETRETAVEKKGDIVGIVKDKISPDVLVLEVSRSSTHKYGDIVHIVTEDFDKWKIADDITVNFSVVELPNNSDQYARIIAEEISITIYFAKPIIYLYPETATECSVKVELDGQLTCTYPEHGEDGWENFTAYPDGTLIFPDGMEYYALYWEGVQDTEWDMTKGFCVKGEDTAKFLEWALSEQGLTRREANEFIMYWLPRMQDNPYNVISFQTEAYTDGAKLEISPSPDSLLRVFMAYYPADTEIQMVPQEFDGFTRNGFTVVEWGGTEIK